MKAALAALLRLLIAACTTRLPATAFDRPVSQALPTTTATPLAQQHLDASGLRLLPTGTDALQARIALARAATKTLDMQYYIANEDNSGKLLLAAALCAADRGVRVHMLVDDLNFKDIDRIMAALNTHENIKIRVFNPYGSAQRSFSERTQNFFSNVDHFTRRMHNKAMIADNQIATVGERNLGDEYWNSTISYPLRAHWRNEADPLNATPLAQQIARHELGLIWAPTEFWADSPTKILHPSDDYKSSPMQRLGNLLKDAQTEFLVLSPYFVPQDTGVKALAALTRRKVRVAVLTNSLAATNAVAVQAGYAPYRIPLLRKRRRTLRIQADADRRPSARRSVRLEIAGKPACQGICHRLEYPRDRFDESRSALLNTELALVIHSKPIADEAAKLFDRGISPEASWRVELASEAVMQSLRRTGSPQSGLVWTTEENGSTISYDLDPEASLYRNVMTGIFTLLPVDKQL